MALDNLDHANSPRVGIDLDNTIVCYDRLFHTLAREQNLIPADLPANKSSVRDYLRGVGKEDLWTAMQAEGYGPRMREAVPFAGIVELLKALRVRKIPYCVVSHKTRHPYVGPSYDLHLSAIEWLSHWGFFDPDRGGLERDRVFLEVSKQAKLSRIGTLGCTHFFDDLPEFLGDPSFPANVNRILFDPNDLTAVQTPLRKITDWAQALDCIGPAVRGTR